MSIITVPQFYQRRDDSDAPGDLSQIINIKLRRYHFLTQCLGFRVP